MGSVDFYHLEEGFSSTAVFEDLVDEAKEMYGEDCYNGTISTCDLYKTIKIADKYSESARKRAYKQAEKDMKDKISKWECYCYDMGVDHYVVTTAKYIKPTTKVPPVYKLKYTVRETNTVEIPIIESFDKKADAKAEAMKLTAKTGKSHAIFKEYIKVSGVREQGSVIPVTKEYKTKPKRIPDGSELKEVHKYLFAGWAAM